jgi:hypothetical protein
MHNTKQQMPVPVSFGLEMFIAFRRFECSRHRNQLLNASPLDHARNHAVMHQVTVAPPSARWLSGGVTPSAGHSHVPGSS